MPFCGFNNKMLKGLTAFTEGLVEHGLEYRSQKNGETIDQGIQRELSDMTRLLLELHFNDKAKQLMTEGIVKYAMGFYLIFRKSKDKEVIKNITDFFYEMDKKYYDELEGKSEDMKELIIFLNEKAV